MTNLGGRIAASLSGLPDFALYVVASAGLVALFTVLYELITPQREFALIRAGNPAAPISLGGAILGFSIPLAMSVAQSHNLLDMVIWSMVALVVQLGAFLLCGAVVPHSGKRVTDGDVPCAVFLAFVSVAAGLINAACMTYPAP